MGKINKGLVLAIIFNCIIYAVCISAIIFFKHPGIKIAAALMFCFVWSFNSSYYFQARMKDAGVDPDPTAYDTILERTTNIQTFVVCKPCCEMETVGEELHLSMFGEYCPAGSMRSYTLFFLLTHPRNFCIKTINDKGMSRRIEPPISPATVRENNFN